MYNFTACKCCVQAVRSVYAAAPKDAFKVVSVCSAVIGFISWSVFCLIYMYYIVYALKLQKWYLPCSDL